MIISRLMGVILLRVILLSLCCLIWSAEAKAGELSERLASFPQWEKIKTVKSAQGELVYPDWIEGNWQLKSTLVDLVAPLAPDVITPGFEGNRPYLQQPISFPVKFVPHKLIEPNLKDLNLKLVNRKESKGLEIVADRAFNALSIARAYLGERTVLSVKVDPDSSLRQITFLRGKCPNKNYGQRICERQLVSVVKSRATEYTQDGQFITCEVFQQFFKGTDSPYFNTVESTTAYRKASQIHKLPEIQKRSQTQKLSQIQNVPTNQQLLKNQQQPKNQQPKNQQPKNQLVITAEQVTAVYLSPQDPNYFKAGSQPVALYKYHLDFYR